MVDIPDNLPLESKKEDICHNSKDQDKQTCKQATKMQALMVNAKMTVVNSSRDTYYISVESTGFFESDGEFKCGPGHTESWCRNAINNKLRVKIRKGSETHSAKFSIVGDSNPLWRMFDSQSVEARDLFECIKMMETGQRAAAGLEGVMNLINFFGGGC